MVTFCNILNQRHSTHFTNDSFVQWHAWQIANITKDEFFRTLDEAWFNWTSIPPTEQALEQEVQRIREFGQVHIVTGRSEETVRPARAWLKEQHIPYDAFVRTASTAAKAELNYDVFVDDSAELMAMIASTNDRSGILYSQPWNREAAVKPPVFRVDRWVQIADVLRQVSTMKDR